VVKVALVGATGAVGETLLRVLEERAVPVGELHLFASRERAEPLEFGGAPLPVRAASGAALAAGRYDAVMFASSDDASGELAGPCLISGAVVIDNSAAFRLDPNIPLIVPEVNAAAIGANDRLFPVANCTAIVLVVALAPVLRVAGLESVRVATYQAVSGAGRAGLEALALEEREAHGLGGVVGSSGIGSSDGGNSDGNGGNGSGAGNVGNASPFVAPIFRNVVPQIGSIDEHGDSGEEKKVAAETRKILNLRDLHVAVTSVRVPVRHAHSEAVFFETARDTSVTELAAAFAAAPGVVFHPTGIVTPREVEGQDLIHVARLRAEGDSKRHFQMWIAGDQLRKGAATNAVQILETLIALGRFKSAAREVRV
jgi:aspartate-semialdehyde dehydrogenase